jgi:hypothetical protein
MEGESALGWTGKSSCGWDIADVLVDILDRPPGRLRLHNTVCGTEPVIVHAHGHHQHKPHWQPIRAAFFQQPRRAIGHVPDLTIITCNNGHAAMGLLERGLDHLGIPYRVGGAGVAPWLNSRDKPRAIVELLAAVETPYVLYADSRDALVLDDPDVLVARFKEYFKAALVFSADRMNWPPVRRFQRFEDALAASQPGDFRYLNGGVWIGRTEFCRTFFAEACRTPPLAQAPESEQGILRELLQRHHPRVVLDHRCRLFQNIGFVVAPILDLEVGGSPAKPID